MYCCVPTRAPARVYGQPGQARLPFMVESPIASSPSRGGLGTPLLGGVSQGVSQGVRESVRGLVTESVGESVGESVRESGS